MPCQPPRKSAVVYGAFATPNVGDIAVTYAFHEMLRTLRLDAVVFSIRSTAQARRQVRVRDAGLLRSLMTAVRYYLGTTGQSDKGEGASLVQTPTGAFPVRPVSRSNILRRLWQIYRELGRCDIYIERGVFQDFGRIKELTSEIVLPFVINVLARLRGVPTVFLTSAVEPVETRTGRWLCRRMFSWSRRIVLRDADSARLVVQKYGAPSEKVVAALDLALVLRRFDATRDPAKPVRRIGVNLIPAFTLGFKEGAEPQSESYANEAARLFTRLAERKMEGLFFFNAPHDADTYARVCAALSTVGAPSPTLREPARPEELAELLTSLDAAIISHYHGIIFAVFTATPFVPIVYHEKVASLVDRLGWKDYAVAVEDFTCDAVLRKLDLLCRNYSQCVERLESLRTEMHGEAERNIQALREALG